MNADRTQEKRRVISQINLLYKWIKYTPTFGCSVLALNVSDFSFTVNSFFRW